MEVLYEFIRIGRQKKRNKQLKQWVNQKVAIVPRYTQHAMRSATNPVRFILTAGQESEFGQANALIEGFNVDYLLADKAYDSNDFIAKIEKSAATTSRTTKEKSNRAARV